MPRGYWIARVDVTDTEHYRNYIAANAAAFARFDGRFLVRGGEFSLVEGKARARNAIIEFPSYEAALACWHSPEYKDAKARRDGHCEIDLVIIRGYDGPQPA